MDQKENAQPRNAELSAPSNGTHRTSISNMTARQIRVLRALLDSGDWITREAIDRISGASNGPEVIRQLRQRFGYGSIEMERITVVDRDGLLAQPGRYRLTDTGRQCLAEMEGRNHA